MVQNTYTIKDKLTGAVHYRIPRNEVSKKIVKMVDTADNRDSRKMITQLVNKFEADRNNTAEQNYLGLSIIMEEQNPFGSDTQQA